jgi:hypothetical protein
MKKLTEKQRLELEARYDEYIHNQCGILHNQIYAWVSESKVPLIQVMLVLELLLEECKRECYKKYLEE